MEERRYKQPNENAFGDDRQREICRDIMAKTGAAIEISSGKDQGLTIMVTGKPELLAKARRMALTQLQTQVTYTLAIQNTELGAARAQPCDELDMSGKKNLFLERKIGVTECPRLLNPRKAVAMAICPIIVHCST